MPPEQQALFAQLFSEVEHANNHQDPPAPATPQLELKLNTKNKSNYYEPKWFNSTNG
jgi:hypothetical protein